MDNFGFTIGEEKKDAQGKLWTYIGNNQWQLVEEVKEKPGVSQRMRGIGEAPKKTESKTTPKEEEPKEDPLELLNESIEKNYKEYLKLQKNLTEFDTTLSEIPETMKPTIIANYNKAVNKYNELGTSLQADMKKRDEIDLPVEHKEPTWGNVVYHSLKSGLGQYQASLVNVLRLIQMGGVKATDAITNVFNPDWYDPNKDFLLNSLTKIVKDSEQISVTNQEQAQSKNWLKKIVGTGLQAVPQIAGAIAMGAGMPVSAGVSATKPTAELTTRLTQMLPFGVAATGGHARNIEQEYEALGKEAPYLKMVIGGALGGAGEMATELPVFMGISKLLKGGGKALINKGAKTLVDKYGKLGIEFLKDIALQTWQEAQMEPIAMAIHQAVGIPQDLSVKNIIKRMGEGAYSGLAMGLVLGGLGGGIAGSAKVVEKTEDIIDKAMGGDKQEIRNAIRKIAEIQNLIPKMPEEEAFAYREETPKTKPIPIDKAIEIQKKNIEKETSLVNKKIETVSLDDLLKAKKQGIKEVSPDFFVTEKKKVWKPKEKEEIPKTKPKKLTPEELEAKREMLLKRGVKKELLTDEFVEKATIKVLEKADVTDIEMTPEEVEQLEKLREAKIVPIAKPKEVLEKVKVKEPVIPKEKVSPAKREVKPEVKREVEPPKIPPKPPQKVEVGEPIGDPITKLKELINKAKPKRVRLETEYTKERGKRIAEVERVLNEIGGEEGYKIALSKLKGELVKPKAKIAFEPIKEKLSKPETDSLYNITFKHPYLDEWEKISAAHELTKLLQGELPTPKGLVLLEEIYGSDLIRGILSKRALGLKITDVLIDLGNLPRAILATADMSAFLRQGIIPVISHPIISAKAMGKTFEFAFSPKAFEQYFKDITKDPLYPLMKKSGLDITDPARVSVSNREEAFISHLAGQIPIVGHIIRFAERAYVGFLNKLRVDLFKTSADELLSKGLSPVKDIRVFKASADVINTFTGRGSMGTLNRITPQLNIIFFSPRLITARFNALNPIWYAKMPKEIRIKAIRDFAKFVSFGVTLLAVISASGLGDVEDDPRSSDFGKIRIGNTRWDIWGGFQQWARVFAQLMTGQRKNTATGEIISLSKDEYPFTTRKEVLLRFIEGKLAPVPALINELMAGAKTFTGEDMTFKTVAREKFIPMYIQDIAEAYADGGFERAAIAGTTAFFGVGVQTWQPRKLKAKSIDEINLDEILGKMEKTLGEIDLDKILKD